MLEAHCLVCEAYQLSEVGNQSHISNTPVCRGEGVGRKVDYRGEGGIEDKACSGVLEHSTCTCICTNVH